LEFEGKEFGMGSLLFFTVDGQRNDWTDALAQLYFYFISPLLSHSTSSALRGDMENRFMSLLQNLNKLGFHFI
jgi:hypothetical protein